MKIGAPLSGEEITPANLLKNTLLAAEACFSSRSFLKTSLSASLFTALHRHGTEHYVHDGLDDSRISFQKLHAASLVLSDRILVETSNLRVWNYFASREGRVNRELSGALCG